jgi:superfamily II DNA helicase RecQ
MAIKAAKDRGWESYRSIERFSAGAEICRRRQILDHFGDEEECRPSGRCCDVCDADAALQRVASTPIAATAGRRAGRAAAGSRAHSDAPRARVADGRDDARQPVDADEFEQLRAWRWERAEGKPAYTVAANTVLEEVLRRRPTSMQNLIEIRGIGRSFCEKHGESLLAAVGELENRRATAA